MKTISIPSDHKLISFDVKSLFTNVPLDFTIDLILKRIYEDNEIQTNIKKKDMKQVLRLCTKNVRFSYDGTIYQQCDGIAIGSPLGPALARIFMVHIERTLIPTLTEHMKPWKRYVDDTVSIIKETSIANVLTVLKNFHKNIEFTYEVEGNGKIKFLDVLIIRNNNTLKTTVCRKKTHNRVYLHWKSFAPPTWKSSTLCSIITRAYRICSTQEYLEAELLKIKHEFTHINGYPKWMFHKINEVCKLSRNLNITTNNKSNINNDITNTTHMLVLPYKGERGQRIIKSINKAVKKILPQNHVTQNVYKSKKLGSCFNIKDFTKLEQQHDLTYFTQCPGVNCNETYLGKTARRLQERSLSMVEKTEDPRLLNIVWTQVTQRYV